MKFDIDTTSGRGQFQSLEFHSLESFLAFCKSTGSDVIVKTIDFNKSKPDCLVELVPVELEIYNDYRE